MGMLGCIFIIPTISQLTFQWLDYFGSKKWEQNLIIDSMCNYLESNSFLWKHMWYKRNSVSIVDADALVL